MGILSSLEPGSTITTGKYSKFYTDTVCWADTERRFILSDPRVWGDPEIFRPERFLAPNADSLPNPLVIVFGYGARCVFV